MRAIVIQHSVYDPPAMIGDVLRARGAQVQVVRTDLGNPLPALDEFDVLVVMGGPMSALDDEKYPYLAAERALLLDCVHRDLPVLGVCLGAQLLAAALGAAVWRGTSSEVGLGSVTLTPAGQHDPVLGPAGPELPVLHWHHDTFGLPPRAELLASSELYPHQAFRLGQAYGLQFHIEMDPATLEQVAPHLPEGVTIDVTRTPTMARVGRDVLRRWVEGFSPAASERTRSTVPAGR